MPIKGLIPEWMIVDSVRYSIGRATYHIMLVTDWIIKHWDKMSLPIHDIIRHDVEDAFKRYSQGQASLGHKCDKKMWENVRKLWENQ